MNPKVTSEEEILQTCRDIVSEDGIQALNMRAIAERQGIALGSLYHYFPSKEMMITSAVESVWQDIFHLQEPSPALSFSEYVQWLYDCVAQSRKDYPNFSMSHSLSFASSNLKEARDTMIRCFSQIKQGLLESLEHDPSISSDVFTRSFSKNEFVDFVFSSFYVSLIQGKDNSAMLLQVIDRCLNQ